MKTPSAIFIIIFLFGTAAFAQFGLSLAVGVDKSEQQFNPSWHKSFMLGMDYHFTDYGNPGLELRYAGAAMQVQTLQHREQVPVGITDLRLSWGLPVTAEIVSLRVIPFLAPGYKWISRSSRQIDLGALGSRRIPPATDGYFTMAAGFSLSKQINAALSLFFKPEISVYDTSGFNRQYSFSGGIHVRLL